MKANNYSLVLLVGIFWGCSDGAQLSPSNSTVSLSAQAQALTIDNAGVVPVFPAGDSTVSVIYVHNNSQHPLSSISYSATSNVAAANGALLTESSVANCRMIAAGQSCALVFSTPPLSGKQTQGSLQLTARAQASGKSFSVSNLINFARVASAGGALLSSDVALNGFGNPTAYATLYLYGSGAEQSYNLSALHSSNPQVSVLQRSSVLNNGSVLASGETLTPNTVQAIEVSAAVGGSGYSGVLTASSTQGSGSYASHAQLQVLPTSNSALLTAGVVPLVNSSSQTPVATMLITNAGNESAQLISPSLGAGLSLLSNGCGAQLAPFGKCSLSFSVSPAGGSANVTLPYSYSGSTGSVSLVQNVTWYNGVGGVLLQMSAAPSSLSFDISAGESTTVSLTNLGGYPLSNISLLPPTILSGSGSASVVPGSSTCGSGLALGASCQYQLSVSDPVLESNKQINLAVSASYNGSFNYTRLLPLSYSTTESAALLTLSTAAASIVANNSMTESLVLVTTNNGNVAATLSNNGVGILVTSPLIAFLHESSTTCSATLAMNSSCNTVFQFGPSATVESGTASYTLNYSGGDTPANTHAVGSINWIVAPNGSAHFTALASNSGFAAGTGVTVASEFHLQSSTPATLTLQYTNNGITAASNFTTTPGVLPSGWSLSGANHGCNAASVAVGGSCTDVYTLNSATIGSNPNLNLSGLTAAWVDGQGAKSAQSVAISNYPSGIFYVAIYGPAAVNVSANASSIYSGQTVTITFTLSGGYNLPALTYTASMGIYPGITNNSCTIPIGGSSCVVSLSSTGVQIGIGLYYSTGSSVAPNPLFQAFNLSGYNIFQTSSTLTGAFGGVTGADAICNSDANRPDPSVSYKALISDGTSRVACTTANCTALSPSWVMKPNWSYFNASQNLIGTTNSAGIFTFPLTNAVPGSGNAWTGLAADWTPGTYNCVDWTQGNAAHLGAVGAAGVVNANWLNAAISTNYCGQSNALYCVQQP